MQKRFLVFSSAFILIILSAFSIKSFYTAKDTAPIVYKKGLDYKKEWEKVDSLEMKGLPQSALDLTVKIYDKAKTENNIPQVVKSLMYQIKIINYVEEDGLVKAIDRIEKELLISNTPIKQILHSVNAELYFNYFKKNQWKIFKVTPLEDNTSGDIQTWDVKKISRKIVKEYQTSLLESDSLQRISISTIEPLILFEDNSYQRTWPTLYDFVAYRAINAFSKEILGLTRASDEFNLDAYEYFDPTVKFIKIDIESNDSTSLKYQAIKTLQELVKFHTKLENPDALIDVELFRLKMIHDHSKNHEKDTYYLEALQLLLKQFEKVPYSSHIRYYIAEIAHKKANALKSNIEEKEDFARYNQLALEQINILNDSKVDSIILLKSQHLLNLIEQPQLSITNEETALPNEYFPVNIKAQNIHNLKLTVYKIDHEKFDAISGKRLYGEELYSKLVKASDQVSLSEIQLDDLNDYQNHSADLILSPLDKGLYILGLEGYSKKGDSLVVTYSTIKVTELSYLQKSHDTELEVLVLNRKTGEPMPNVNVKVWYKDYSYRQRKQTKKNLGTFVTNDKGLVKQSIPKSRNVIVEVSKEDDRYTSDRGVYMYEKGHSQDNYRTHYFLDRAIYRPGQTVYFKAMTLGKNGDKNWLLKGKELEITLKDVNYQKVSSLKLKSNEFGSISGSFVLPVGVLTGRMHLQSQYGNMSFKVEEYKRPRFEVKLDDFSGNYKLNENIKIKGTAIGFAGENITDAKFKYRVVRKPNYSYNWRISAVHQSETEIASGEGISNDKGEFEFDFMAKVENLKADEDASFSYHMTVDVVDITGETHTDTRSINIGTTALKLNMQIPESINYKQAYTFKLLAENLNGQEIPASVDLQLQQIQSSNTLKKRRLWQEPDAFLDSKADWEKQLPNYQYSNKDQEDIVLKEVLGTKINTKEDAYWKLDKNLEEGFYKLTMKATGPFGKEIVKEQTFTVLNQKSKKMPKADQVLFSLLTKAVEPGEKAELLIGSSFKDIKALLEIDRKGKPIEKRWINLSDSKQKISIPITEEDRGSLYASLYFVYEDRSYKRSVKIKVPYTNKELDLAFETFRSKLYPGQKEEWKVKIKGRKGEMVAAEFLAAMYDASLDQFAKNTWNFNILHDYSRKQAFAPQGFSKKSGRSVFSSFTQLYNPSLSKPELDWFGFNIYGRYYATVRTKGKRNRKQKYRTISCPSFGDEVAEEAPAIMHSTITSKGVVRDELEIVEEEGTLVDFDKGEVAGNANQNSQTPMEKGRMTLKVRKNFDETAFFYPQLRTNEEGDVVFSFTMPESLTKWNFKGFAHTEDLKYGFIDEEIVTQKDLMVMPNAPRFFREGDTMEFPFKVSNLSDKTLDVDATLRFYDALNMKEITQEICPENKTHQLNITAKQSGVFTASLQIPEGYQSISYKVIARAGNFADGEEKAIPVLSNRMLVTESMPLPIRGKGTKTFTFGKLLNNKSKSLTNYTYALEMTSNPAWYAVQALPYLAEYPHECAEQTFSRFYANALASHIANSSPKIKSVFDAWRNAPNSKTLISNLDKNQELKSALLQETPWVMDAQNETEQKRRIAMLFDLNQLTHTQASALRKLKEMQVSSGAWPWFKGMRENRYITQLIVSGMGHLRQLNVLDLKKDHQTFSMIKKAVGYLDGEIGRDYKRLKKYSEGKKIDKTSHTNSSQIQFLYMRSFFNDLIPVPAKSKEAITYYTENSRKFWINQSQYLQAMIAISSLRDTKAKTSVHTDIVASLKENALHSEEMGMYWKANSGYYWYEAPIEKQALMIELFSEIGGEKAAVEDLKVWLLKQKQTQSWKTTRSTADAIYALLMNGTDLLSNDELVQVSLGGEKIKATKDNQPEAGTGYLKTVWKGEEVKPEMGEITLKKKNDGVAWGAVYWQYFEDLDKITPHKTPLHIEKELFIENNSSSGKELKVIKEGDIKVGDKIIVRIILRVDRAMEYVHLKDMRASGFEPLNVMSGYRWKNGLGYYESTKDASTNFFFDYVKKGTYVFEYPLRAVLEGDFSNGISNIQCMYAPEFTSHSEGIRVVIKK